MDKLILVVDNNDNPLTFMDKMEVHRKGLTHRAFSVVLLSPDKKKMLIQRRALNKYHSGGLWANACCSHQRQGEELEESVSLRLMEELGVKADLEEILKFHYRVEFENGLVEDEIDHVFMGILEDTVKPNSNEVCEVKWIDIDKLKRMDKIDFAYWFKEIILRLETLGLI